MLLNSTVIGALPDFTSTEKEAVGGTGVGVGIGVAVGLGVLVGVGAGGVAVGSGVDVGLVVGCAGFGGTGVAVNVAFGACAMLGAAVDDTGKAVTTGVSDVSEGIIRSHAGKIARVSTMNIRNVSGVFFTFDAPCICPLSRHGNARRLPQPY